MLIYELLTLTKPYEGEPETEIMKMICQGKRPQLPDVFEDSQYKFLRELYDVCTRMPPGKRPTLGMIRRALTLEKNDTPVSLRDWMEDLAMLPSSSTKMLMAMSSFDVRFRLFEALRGLM